MCLRIVGLNTVLVGGRKDDLGKLQLGLAQLAGLRTGQREIVLALSHHPIDWLSDQESVRPRLRGGIDVHLFGHVHGHESEKFRRGGGKDMISVCAGAVHGDSSDVTIGHGYSFGAMYKKGDDLIVRVWPRRWDKNDRFIVHSEHTEANRNYAEHQILRRLSPFGAERGDRGKRSQGAPSVEVIEAGFDAQQDAPFSTLLQGRGGNDATTALFADRFLLAIRSRMELADLPRRIQKFLTTSLNAAEAEKVEGDWRHALGGAVGLQNLPPPAALPPLRRLLDPVAACIPRLREALRSLITRPIPQEMVDSGRFAMSREQLLDHLRKLRGRDQYVTQVLEYLSSHESRVVLIMAPEGFGKSAIVSAVAERLRIQGDPVGPSAALVRRECNWLPGALLLFGKVESDPEGIVQMLVAQANAMLLRPVTIPMEEPREVPFLLRDENLLMLDKGSHPITQLRRSRTARPLERSNVLRSMLTAALCRLVDERGPIVLILDALDEISPDGSLLSFLPDVVPEGVALLLATRPEEGILHRLRPLHPLELVLKGVDET